jgi:hypothetical protein
LRRLGAQRMKPLLIDLIGLASIHPSTSSSCACLRRQVHVSESLMHQHLHICNRNPIRFTHLKRTERQHFRTVLGAVDNRVLGCMFGACWVAHLLRVRLRIYWMCVSCDTTMMLYGMRRSSGRWLSVRFSTMVDIVGKVATLRLASGPANVLTMETLQSLRAVLKELEANQAVHALVVTSAADGVFSAGLDIKELYAPDRSRLVRYWGEMQSCVTELYGSRLATLTRLNGHAIAGGCIIALATDYRAMLAPSKIGLNEAALGMTVPWWISDLLGKAVGPKLQERLISLAEVSTAPNALTLGLVDQGPYVVDICICACVAI